MSKRIAIVTRQMIMGGVERALIAMLEGMVACQLDVTLYVQFPGGALMDQVPPQVKVQVLAPVTWRDGLTQPRWGVEKAVAAARLLGGKGPYTQQCRWSASLLRPVEAWYDIAIAYHAPNTVPAYFVAQRMQAGEKVLWLHGDLDTNSGDDPALMACHARYDRIYGVSRQVVDSFVRRHPHLAPRAQVFYNFVDVQGLRRRAEEGPALPPGAHAHTLLTIARLTPQKGLPMAVECCKRLVEQGLDVVWYVCGEGEQRGELERQIAALGLTRRFILLGNVDNPLHYLRQCTLYVQPSHSEGYCTTTNEARLLGCPVVTTQVSGAQEQFVSGETGWIVPIDVDELTRQVAWCLRHPQACQAVRRRLAQLAQQDEQQGMAVLKEWAKDG